MGGGVAQGIKFDSLGNLYTVGRAPNVIDIFANANGTPVTITSSSFSVPIDAAADSSGNVFVADLGGGVLEFLSGHTGNVAADHVFTGLSSPTAVAVDASNNVYAVSDGGSPYVAIYAPGATSPTATISNSGFGRTGGIAVDSAGDIIVLDFDNLKIYVWAPNTPGSITGGYTRTRTLTTGATLSVAVDRFGNIYAVHGTFIEIFNTSAVTGPSSYFYPVGGPPIYGIAVPPGL
jgi:hypothetical protein